jgi:ankyrin repeat protein
MWACEYGHLAVVEFLLEHGVAAAARPRGETGLHWAAYGGHVEIVRLLLAHDPPMEPDDRFDATPLGWAQHGREHPRHEPGGGRHDEVIALLRCMVPS